MGISKHDNQLQADLDDANDTINDKNAVISDLETDVTTAEAERDAADAAATLAALNENITNAEKQALVNTVDEYLVTIGEFEDYMAETRAIISNSYANVAACQADIQAVIDAHPNLPRNF